MANETKGSKTTVSVDSLWTLFYRSKRGAQSGVISALGAVEAERVGRALCDRLSADDVVGRGVTFIRVEPFLLAGPEILQKPAVEPEPATVGA